MQIHNFSRNLRPKRLSTCYNSSQCVSEFNIHINHLVINLGISKHVLPGVLYCHFSNIETVPKATFETDEFEFDPGENDIWNCELYLRLNVEERLCIGKL